MRARGEHRRPRAREEYGQVLPIVAALIAVIGVVGLQLGRLGEAAVTRAQARTAADAAALAGAVDGRGAAEAMAKANGAKLISYREISRDALVTVKIGDARAEARARGSDVAPGGGGGGGGAGSTTGLAPAMRAAMARAAGLLGHQIPVTSGFRSVAQQQALWNNRHNNPYPVARPGTSMHGRGLAIDVPLSFVPLLLRVGRSAGLCQPYPRTDPVHFELCR